VPPTWVCQWDAFPGIIWTASGDMTSDVGITCRRLESPLPGSSVSSQLRIGRLLLKLLEFHPF
jgi:hypothetical protein